VPVDAHTEGKSHAWTESGTGIGTGTGTGPGGATLLSRWKSPACILQRLFVFMSWECNVLALHAMQRRSDGRGLRGLGAMNGGVKSDKVSMEAAIATSVWVQSRGVSVHMVGGWMRLVEDLGLVVALALGGTCAAMESPGASGMCMLGHQSVVYDSMDGRLFVWERLRMVGAPLLLACAGLLWSVVQSLQCGCSYCSDANP